ncbi:hypothetical protein [Vibrio sonorensis]|uniref:hypothetical protein n=1 Tax=Vibrio sonorensis TaxID=1004316 RepID=UPI0008DAE105|nr:hypothetical protein [Vibrio sonorensis]
MDSKVLIASHIDTLYDLTKTSYCKGAHIHCQFEYKKVTSEANFILNKFKKIGVKSIYFQDLGITEITPKKD